MSLFFLHSSTLSVNPIQSRPPTPATNRSSSSRRICDEWKEEEEEEDEDEEEVEEAT
jgi:hypothetical protein